MRELGVGATPISKITILPAPKNIFLLVLLRNCQGPTAGAAQLQVVLV